MALAKPTGSASVTTRLKCATPFPAKSVDFNYGVFDFNESNFFVNFARGHMHYLMDAEYSAPEQASYTQDGRSVTRQRLAFTPQQAAALRDFLLWNLRPENAGYNYDYYADNCTTRVRDALDKILGGALKTQLMARPGGMTFRQQTARLMSAQPWLMLVLDLGLGPYADQPLNAWQESFLPMVLQEQLRTVRIDNGHDGTQPLVQSEQLISPNRLDVPPVKAPDLRLPLAAAGLFLAVVILLTRRWWPIGYALLELAVPDRSRHRRHPAAGAVDTDHSPLRMGQCQPVFVQSARTAELPFVWNV
jgi:hypothetical protein